MLRKNIVALFSAGICYCSTRRRKAMQRSCEAGSVLRSNQSDKHTVGTRDVAEAKMLVKATRDIIIRINNKCAGPDLAAYCKSSLDCILQQHPSQPLMLKT